MAGLEDELVSTELKEAEELEAAGTPEAPAEPAAKTEPEGKSEPRGQPDQGKSKEVEESALDAELAKHFEESEAEPEKPAERTVPVGALAAERAKVRELKEQLKKAQEGRETQGSLEDDLLLQLADDDPVTAKELRQVLRRTLRERSDLEAAIDVKLAERDRQREIAHVTTVAKASEREFRKDHEDFDTVISQARALNLISREERHAALTSQNPAAVLYGLAQTKLGTLRTVLGHQKAKPASAKTKGAETEEIEGKPQTEDEAFEEVFAPPT